MPLQPPPMPNDIVASYTLEKSIGIGGNANVFLASSAERGKVAIKILHPGKTSQEDIKRFQREFVVLNQLDHPNIISPFEVGVHNGYPWMAMELAEEGDVSSLIKTWKKKAPPERFEQVRDLFVQICSALEAIHQAGMIHRDLKPSNILLAKGFIPKITDFGGVKAPNAFQTELTQMGKLIGTVAFMAPEQILGDTIDKRADLYSLGMILYIFLTGQKPFEADNVTSYLSKHITEMPPHPQKINQEIPKDLADICFKLLQKDPYKRYSSAKQVASLLQNQTNLPVLIGRTKQFKQIEKILQNFVQKEQSATLCMLGPSGVGRKDFIKYIIHQLKRATIPISTTLQLPPHQVEKYCFWLQTNTPSPQFLKETSDRIKHGDSVLFLVTKSQHLKLIEKHIAMMSFSIVIPPLALSDTQDLLRQVNITGKRNVFLSKRLQYFLKGRQEYIQQALSDSWIQELEATPFKHLHKIMIPIPENLREQYTSHLKRLSKPEKQLLECILVYQHPASQTTLLRISGQSPEEFLYNCSQLEEARWLSISIAQEEPRISLASHLLELVLLELIPKSRRVSWHTRIAAILDKQHRLSLKEQIQLANHLKQSEQLEQFAELLLKIIKGFTQTEELAKANHYLQELHLINKEHPALLSSEKQFHLFSKLGRNYQKQGEQEQAVYYFNKALNQKDCPATKRLDILIKSCLLEYNSSYFQEALEMLPKNHPRLLELLKQHATHAFYHFDFSTAKETWSNLESLPFREAQIVGQAGRIILEDWGAVDSDLWKLLEDNLLDSSFTWIVWYIEHNICCGHWVKAVKTIHNVIPHIPEESYKYWHLLALDAWLQALLGKTTQAKQLITQLEEKLPSPCMIEYARIAILILRTQLYIGASFSSFSISWELFPYTIDELSTQHFLLQKSHKIPSRSRERVKIETPLHWLRDILLCDQALSRVNSSQEERLHIWEQLQVKHHALRLIITLHFARSSQTDAFIIFWTKHHEIELKACLQNSQSSQYNFQNWKK